MTSFWNPKLARRNIKERFESGGVAVADQVSTANWQVTGGPCRGRTIEPHYFPLGQDDVHLFDFHVFPQYRGQGMNPYPGHPYPLQIWQPRGRVVRLSKPQSGTEPQLSSLGKLHFDRLGFARKLTLFGRTIVCWGKNTACGSAGLHPGISRTRTVKTHGSASALQYYYSNTYLVTTVRLIVTFLSIETSACCANLPV